MFLLFPSLLLSLFVLFVLCLLDFCFRSNFPFWTLWLTCLLLFFFGEFESEKFSFGRYYSTKSIRNEETYRQARQWIDFESRKGFRVMSYVGSFLGVFGEVFFFFFEFSFSIRNFHFLFFFLKFRVKTYFCLRLAS